MVIRSSLQKWRNYSLKLKVLLFVIVLLIATSLVLPLILKNLLITQLQKQGFQTVELQSLGFNVFSGRLTLDGLTLKTSQAEPLKLQHLEVDLNWLGLLQRRLSLQKVALDNTQIILRFTPGQSLEVAGFTIPLNDTDKKPSTETDQPNPLVALGITMGVDTLRLSNVQLIVELPQGKRQVLIDEITLNHLQSWQPQDLAQLTFKIVIGPDAIGGQLAGDFWVQPFSEIKTLKGNVLLNQFNFARQQAFYPAEVGNLQGLLTTKIALELTQHHSQISLKNNLGLSLKDLQWSLGERAISQTQFDWVGNLNVDWHPTGDLAIRLEGLADSHGFDFKQPNQQLSFQTLHFPHKVSVSQKAGNLQGTYQGDLTLSDLMANLTSPESKQNSTKVNQIALKGQASFEGSLPKTAQEFPRFNFAYQQALALKEGKLHAKAQDLTAALNSFNVSVDGQGKMLDQQLSLDMQTTQSLTDFSATQQELHAAVKDNQWQGKVQVSLPLKASDETADKHNSLQLAVLGNLKLGLLKLDNPKQKTTIVDWQGLSSDIGFTTPQTLALSHFDLQGFKFGQPENATLPLVQWDSLQIDTLNLEDDQSLQIGKVHLERLASALLINPEKQLPQLDQTLAALGRTQHHEESTQDKSQDKSQEKLGDKPIEEKAKKQPVIDIASLTISPDSQLKITTQATVPAIESLVRVKQFEIGAIKSALPKHSTPLDIQVQVDDYAQLSLKGVVEPFGEKVNAQLKADISDLDLYHLSPLIKRDLGYRIESGGLNLQNTTKIVDSKLEAKNHLKLIGFALEKEPAQTKQTSEVKNSILDESNSSEMPDSPKVGAEASGVATALAIDLLRDKNNNIVLDVPISGDLNDPSFHPAQVIRVALQNALTSGSKAMLLMTLQPYGAIALATKYAYDKATAIYLENVKAVVGQATLKPDMDDYLNKVADLLKKQPAVNLKVCGYYTAADQDYLTQKQVSAAELPDRLFKLAQARQGLVKEQLVSKGVESNRLTLCHPSLKDEPQPGVSLSI
ncbi:DUF748 domain-containing protein [Thiosulfativibrio zosterae]|uniref:DUF748 domain-containing protein n=1 Tax=Thiosulfativibrio zosterae TaxID=2675053 RepID=A0A6F8PPH3_9GAMM|nr:DUF748 domain-containing protein [Thiosulfativibrio zosterae]BBP44021.1 hypothetical protein THMIRHAT_17670 [Thiosulfativibrio zosterae]